MVWMVPFTQLEFKPFTFKPCIFKWKVTVILALYVDNLLLVGDSPDEIGEVIHKLNEKFEVTDLGPSTKFLGIDFARDKSRRIFFLSRENYSRKMLELF